MVFFTKKTNEKFMKKINIFYKRGRKRRDFHSSDDERRSSHGCGSRRADQPYRNGYNLHAFERERR